MSSRGPTRKNCHLYSHRGTRGEFTSGSSGEHFQGSDSCLHSGQLVAGFLHPEPESQDDLDLREDLGLDFSGISGSDAVGGAQSAVGGIRTPRSCCA